MQEIIEEVVNLHKTSKKESEKKELSSTYEKLVTSYNTRADKKIYKKFIYE